MFYSVGRVCVCVYVWIEARSSIIGSWFLVKILRSKSKIFRDILGNMKDRDAVDSGMQLDKLRLKLLRQKSKI